MAVIRMLFSLALSICIWAQSLVFKINLRLPWVLITKANEQDQLGGKRHNMKLRTAKMAFYCGTI